MEFGILKISYPRAISVKIPQNISKVYRNFLVPLIKVRHFNPFITVKTGSLSGIINLSVELNPWYSDYLYCIHRPQNMIGKLDELVKPTISGLVPLHYQHRQIRRLKAKPNFS